MRDTSVVRCVWCETVLDRLPAGRFGVPVWYGVCTACAGGPAKGLFPTSTLAELTATQYDVLPFGLMEVDRSGFVRKYNAAEERLSGLDRSAVLGKHFFRDVAPCTRVKEFESVFHDLFTRGGAARSAFDFVFRFAGGDRFVHIAMCYEPHADSVYILVQVAEERTA